jgi:DNA-binding transcriptional regulator LsrR (DeoR family)
MGRPKEDLLAVQAALLAAEGRSHTDIGRELTISLSAVYKRLKRARDIGLLRPTPPPTLDRTKVAKELLGQATEALSWGQLKAEISAGLRRAGIVRPPTVWITRAPSHKTDAESWDERLASVAALAAGRLRRLLRAPLKVGLAWGAGLHHIVEELQEYVTPGTKASEMVFFPTAGAFPFLTRFDPKLTSTTIAWELAALYGDGKAPADQINLDVVPAYLPAEFEEHEPLLRDLFSRYSAFRRVYGHEGSPGLLDEADCIVTGVGDMPTSPDSGSPSLRARLEIEGLAITDLASLAVGDIAGILLPHDALSATRRSRLEKINGRFVGPAGRHLQACVRRALKADKPGVIALAHGAAKAAAVKKAIEMGLISEVCVDDELARELARLLPPERRSVARKPGANAVADPLDP